MYEQRNIERETEEMTAQLDRIEWKLDQLLMRMSAPQPTTTPMPRAQDNSASMDATHLLHGWTIKQHVVLQMILRSATNDEVAERLSVTTNTAKVHVRTLMKKLRVNTRSEIVAKCLIPFKEVGEDTYLLMTGGMPKDWDVTYVQPDPCHNLIHGETA